jgi:uncharacterized membrane protein YfcA
VFPFEFLDTSFFIALAAAVGAGIIHGFAGFGVGFVLVPVLAFVFGPVEAVAISSSASVVASLPLIPAAVRRMERPEVLPVLAPLLIAVPLGAYLLMVADPLVMRRVIGGLIILSGLLMLRGYRWRGRRTPSLGIAVGVIGGVVGGSSNTGGAIVTAYLLSAEGSSADKRAGILVIATVTSAIGFLTLVLAGAVDLDTLILALILIVPNAAGIWLGAWLFGRSREEVFRRAALVLLLVIGAVALMV